MPTQARAYAGPSRWVYAEGPFAPLAKPLAAARVALLTSSWHFVDCDDSEPFGIKHMTQAEAAARIDGFLKEEPVLSVIPAATPEAQLRVRHGGYDNRSTQADPNVAFPLTHLRALAQEGVIGELAPLAYEFNIWIVPVTEVVIGVLLLLGLLSRISGLVPCDRPFSNGALLSHFDFT